MQFAEPAALQKEKGQGAVSVGTSPCPQNLEDPWKQISHSLPPDQHLIFREVGLQCAWVCPTWASGKQDKVWLWGAVEKSRERLILAVCAHQGGRVC